MEKRRFKIKKGILIQFSFHSILHREEEQNLSKALLEVRAAAYLVKVKEEKYCFYNLRLLHLQSLLYKLPGNP